MTPRQEVTHVQHGTGAIEVRGDRLACGLFVHGKPFVLNWDERSGSICQEVLHNADVGEEAVAYLRRLTMDEPKPTIPLQKQFAPLLQQFAQDFYKLTLSQLPPQTMLVEWHDLPGWYYPDPLNLVATQRIVSEERVLEYMYQIEQGALPTVITVTVPGAWCEFVLDGHHKFCAYGWLKLPAWRLCITALNPKALVVEDWPSDEPPRNFVEDVT